MICVSLSHLLDRGMRLDVAEALAIAQSVAAAPGVPTIRNVQLRSDGTAVCAVRDGTPSVAGLAVFLDALLPATGVPAALRYTVVRGVGAVEAPPFASVEAFSAALHRFEQRERDDVIRGLLARARGAERPERDAADLAGAAVLMPGPASAARRASAWRLAAVAAALAACGVAGFAGAELIHASRLSRSPGTNAMLPPPEPSRSALPPASVATSGQSSVQVEPAPDNGDVEAAQRGAAPIQKDAPPVQRDAVPVQHDAAAVQHDAPAVQPDAAAIRRGAEPVRALPKANAPSFSPAFSPTGTALFFQTGGPRDSTSAIAVASADHWPADDLRIMKVVDDGSRNYHAHPSPDGRFIAFDSDRGGERGVYVADRDGSHVRRVSGPGYAALPTWSPDGAQLAYVRAEAERPSVWNLWVQPINGSQARRITSFHEGQTWTASWFPDGRRVAYSHEDTLTILDLESGRWRRYHSPVAGRLLRTPAVSPDGSKIVFQVWHAGAWVLDLATGSMQCVLADPTAEEFAWAPDGRRLAFHSRRDGEWGVYLMPRG